MPQPCKPFCWCGQPSRVGRSTCSEEHTRRRVPENKCACGVRIATASKQCKACFEAGRPRRLCHCGKPALRCRNTCSPECAQLAHAQSTPPPRRSDSRRKARRAAKRLVYRHPRKVMQLTWRCVAQGGRCAVCRRKEELFLDHCHTRGTPRAALCRRCNAALGLMLESPSDIRALAVYAEACVLHRYQLP